MLPGKTKEQTQSYAASPKASILANTASVQAAKNEELGLTGANFWTDTRQTADKKHLLC